MRKLAVMAVGVGMVLGASLVWAHEGHDHDETAETQAASGSSQQTLTGEVVDVFCYLSHGDQGLGKGHAECARKCIKDGLPVAIRVGQQLYLASMANHTPGNAALADLAGHQVTVQGTVMERDGQHLIAVSEIHKAD